MKFGWMAALRLMSLFWALADASVPFIHSEAPGLRPQWVSSRDRPQTAHPGAATMHSVGGMNVSIDDQRNTITSIAVPAPDLASCFDFVPSSATFGGSHRLGDVTMRVRIDGSKPFASLSTASKPAAARPVLPPPAGELAAADVSGTLDTELPISLTRHYAAAPEGHGLELRFVLSNLGNSTLEVGAWGAAMILETMDTQGGGQRTLDDLAGNASMVDPAIIGHHGWVSATRMTGQGPVLLVVPEGGGGLQAWRQMHEASGGLFYEAMSHSAAWAADEWSSARAEQWLQPTSASVPPQGSLTFAYRLLLAPSVRDKDSAMAAAGFAVVQAVPGYTIATDMANATLHVWPPANASITSVSAQPPNLMTVGPPVAIGSLGGVAIPVRGHAPGRVRVSIAWSDGRLTGASYMVLPPLDDLLARYGQFASEVAWYANTSDPFGRAPCVLGYNRELGLRIGVGPWDGGYEDNRIFNNGLSDEAGAGANVGFAAKVRGAPTAAEVAKLDAYVTQTLYGVKEGLPFGASLQCVEGDEGAEQPSCGPASVVGPTAGGIMASMFWVPIGWPNATGQDKMPGYAYNSSWFCDAAAPPAQCPPGWPGWRWDQARAASLGRAYNYPHQASVYLAMYLAAANYRKLNTTHEPRWYLTRAFKTIEAMWYQASWYAHQGLMDGTVFQSILRALRAEGLKAEADVVEGMMRNRTLVGVDNQCRYYVPPNAPPGDRGPSFAGCHWYLVQNRTTPWAAQTGLPGAGSEFAWDTTGQEEAYVWGSHFGTAGNEAAAKLAAAALDQILAYTPLVPNWAWHGSAYGIGDFGNNGFVRPNERVLQHYRSGLNAIPTTEAFLRAPSDRYLVRLAAGSIGGVLANIDPQTGANSMGFHSDASNLFYDPASGDGGLGLFGHTQTTASFVVHEAELGWLCYFCDLRVDGSTIAITPRDSYRRRVFLSTVGLLLVAEAGRIARVSSALDGTGSMSAMEVAFEDVGHQPLDAYRLRLEITAGNASFVVKGARFVRGAYELPLDAPVVRVQLETVG